MGGVGGAGGGQGAPLALVVPGTLQCAVVTSAAKPLCPQHRRLAAGPVHSFLPPLLPTAAPPRAKRATLSVAPLQPLARVNRRGGKNVHFLDTYECKY